MNTPTKPVLGAPGRGRSSLTLWAVLAAYVTVVVLPLGLAALAETPGRAGLQGLGSALGMLGFSMLLVEFMLSGRLRWLSASAGMDRLMQFHQAMAWVLVGLILLHPYLYGLFPRETGIVGGQPPLAPRDDWVGGLTGFAAWLGLFALVVVAAVRDDLPFSYEAWRLSHGLGALAVALLALWHTLAIGHYAAMPSVAGFWILATLVAALSLFHTYVLRPLRMARRPWRVSGVGALAPGIHEVTIAPDGHEGLAYRAGQFIWLRLHDRRFSLVEHPFSIASAPADGAELRFVIKGNGDFTDRVGDIKPGTPAAVDGPYGSFGPGAADDATEGFLLIAGGVGLAPVLGILRQCAAVGERRPMRLIVANADRDEIVLSDELEALAGRLDLRIVRVVDDPARPEGTVPGPLDQATLADCLSGAAPARWRAFVCAPPGMIDAVEVSLGALGMPAGRIHAERFRYRYGWKSAGARRMIRVQAAVVAVVLAAVVVFLVATAG